jgi:general secretion pathway protein D
MTDDDKALTRPGAQREPAHDKRFGSSWLGTAIAGFVFAALVCACAGQRPLQEAKALFDAGQAEAGLARLEEAVKSEPAKIEFRIALASRRAAMVSRLVGSGELARREGRLSDAEKAFAQALALDPNQVMASQGLAAIKDERINRQALAEAEALFKQGGAAPWAEAQDKLRRVLAENPGHKEALNLKAQINEAQAKLQKPEARLATIYRKPITLEFRDAPLKSVFDVIAKVSGLNFFFDKDLRPDLKATILAKNTSIEDAVRLLLVTNQLEQKILNENSVLIYPNTPQKLKDYQTLTLRTFYLTNADVKAVSNTIKTIVKTKDLVIDERLGLIIMRDTPEAIRVAERIVALQDLSDPEVMLDVEILEIKRSRLLDLGIDWPASLNLTPLQATGSNLTLAALRHISPATTQATIAGSLGITANQQDQDTNTLANPRIRVRNKEKAKILIGDRVPIITTTSTSTGFVSESVNYVDVGLKLEVEPHIYLDDEVGIKINLEVSTLGAQTTSKSGTLTYQIGSRGANTVLRLKDGETQILAGLINDQERASANKVPGLGDLFVIGRLFGSHNDDKQRSEILLSITPHVLRSIRRPDLMAAEFESGTEANIGAETLRMSNVELPAAAADAKPVGAVTAAGAASAANPPTAPKVAATAPPTPIAVLAGGPVFSWLAPAQIKVGEQFSAVLKLSSQSALRGMPLLVGFDPQVLQVAGVVEGDFFKQGNGRSNFSQRVDGAQGKVFVAAVRQGPSGVDGGVNGNASVVTLTFKALKVNVSTRIQLLSATPEPPPASPFALPVDTLLRITP